MDKGQMPNRTVNLSYAPEDQALADELKERFAGNDYPEPGFRFQKHAFAHTGYMNVKMNYLRIGDVICMAPIYPLLAEWRAHPQDRKKEYESSAAINPMKLELGFGFHFVKMI